MISTKPAKGFSIRAKMTMAALLPLLTILLLVTIGAFSLINAWIVGNSQKEIRNDLSAAHEVLRQEERRIKDVVRMTANLETLAEAAEIGDLGRVAQQLAVIRQRENLDLLNLTDPKGELVSQASTADTAAALPFFSKVLGGRGYSGTVLFSTAQLEREEGSLADKARIISKVSRIDSEQRGLVLVGAAPLRNGQGEIIGCLYGGTLLNGNLPLVDRIKQVIYGEQRYEDTEVGSATIFLETMRVATTIRLDNGDRALGTFVSADVASAVLDRKEVWLDRAQVVNDWYLTAYEPILDQNGAAIGALYVGKLEEPYNALKRKITLLLLAFLLFGSALGWYFSYILAKRLSRPLMELATSAEHVAEGNTEIRLPVISRDEVGHLTETFNRMTAALRERDKRLRQLHRNLEEKVNQRTAQLEEKSLQLIETQEKLLRNEKLAAIGSLAAGVAHEINNPTAIIRGNIELLQMLLQQKDQGGEEIDEIMKQTERISLITRNLLNFAREQTTHPEQVKLNALLDDILSQLNHQVDMVDIQVKTSFSTELPTVTGDRERLRQVFTNILLNGVQAMAATGTLSLSSRIDGENVLVSIEDTGCGMSEEVKAKIFNPFFTTKKDGTGLGLSVSYGIIQAHGGTLDVRSSEGVGSTFDVRLPVDRSTPGHPS